MRLLSRYDKTIRAYVKTDSHDVSREVLRLWRGSDEGRPSASEADMAFVKQLYYWCKGDQQLMDECFRVSGRMRPKWDEVHSSDGATYGEMTIQKVCRTNSDTFGERYVER
jgi:putative DNA primase/helicase